MIKITDEMVEKGARLLLEIDGKYILTDPPEDEDDEENNARVIGYYKPPALALLERFGPEFAKAEAEECAEIAKRERDGRMPNENNLDRAACKAAIHIEQAIHDRHAKTE